MIELKPYTNWDEIQPIFEWGCKKALMKSYEIDWYGKAIQDKSLITLVCYNNDKPKGFISLNKIDYCGMPILYIHLIVSCNGYKNILLQKWEFVKVFAKGIGCKEIRCMTKRIGGIRYYKKFGLKPVSTELSTEVI